MKSNGAALNASRKSPRQRARTAGRSGAGRSLATKRQRAETRLRAPSPKQDPLVPHKLQELVHELQVHQVELEMQNEELRRVELELASSRDRFADLFDFAPLGYVTLTVAYRIQEANLTVAAMLGVSRKELIGNRFSRFMPTQWQETFYELCRAAVANGGTQTCELQLQRSDGVLPGRADLQVHSLHRWHAVPAPGGHQRHH